MLDFVIIYIDSHGKNDTLKSSTVTFCWPAFPFKSGEFCWGRSARLNRLVALCWNSTKIGAGSG